MISYFFHLWFHLYVLMISFTDITSLFVFYNRTVIQFVFAGYVLFDHQLDTLQISYQKYDGLL